MEVNICEWCGMRYPKGGFTYWVIEVFPGVIKSAIRKRKVPNFHMICDDCKNQLREV
mgnify:CR=1 FL=1|jgi:hypothetical protein